MVNFIFTEDSFYVDESSSDCEEGAGAEYIRDKYGALYHRGITGDAKNGSASYNYLLLLSEAFFRTLAETPGLELTRENTVPEYSAEEKDSLLRAVPFALGTEYITAEWIEVQFRCLLEIFVNEIKDFDGTVALYFAGKNQKLQVPDRIFFHLVENSGDDMPFAFLATYATKNKDGKVRHMPLKYALTEFKGEREKLLQLLSSLDRVAKVSPLISGFMESGELFHPLRLSSEEAYTFLKSIPEIESAGILCRVPDWWKRKASNIFMNITIGDKKPALLGLASILSMVPELMVDGVRLTEEDIEEMLNETEGLRLIKGKWVEIDHARLRALLKLLKKNGGDLSLLDALKLEAGYSERNADPDVGVMISNGEWLSGLLRKLRRPAENGKMTVPRTFFGKLRDYQNTGAAWLTYMGELGFGACLADDMGLGKTVQLLCFLEKLRSRNKGARALLIVPASLLGNWQKEAERFTPGMPLQILHGMSPDMITAGLHSASAFLNITTYGMVARNAAFSEQHWDCVILDEAQAIKNPLARQTRAVKEIPADYRIAMTGTPIENDMTNLWSLFDYLNKGLLGTSKEFSRYAGKLCDDAEGYGKLRSLVSPFILRRVKSDRRIISDLPDKLETVDYIALSKKQTVLYRRQVDTLAKAIEETDGIKRRGMVLATITKLKQICNHPDQYLGLSTYDAAESGKFGMLKTLCETIYEKRERVLVFTQYREIAGYLENYLATIFHRSGLLIDGSVTPSERTRLVEQFDGERYVPFMILTVKAGGTGLNLTAANHVIHFDRWWNPAVENQATDRAFRIGQKKNVVVHKFVCSGTIEEKIDTIINSKKELAENVIGNGGEKWITELGNAELLNLLRLENV